MNGQNYLRNVQLAEIINSNIDEHDNFITKLCVNSEMIDFETFKNRLLKEIDEIDCTPSKDGITFEEIQDILEEIENVPSKLHRQRKHKDLQKLNSTAIQKKDKEENCIKMCGQSRSQVDLDINSVPFLKADCHLSPKEVLKDFNDCKHNIRNILKKFGNNEDKMCNYNNEMEKIKNFIRELEIIVNQNSEKNCGENSLTKNEEQDLKMLVNGMEQYIFVNENKNLFVKKEGDDNVENLNILIEIINDLLKNVVLN